MGWRESRLAYAFSASLRFPHFSFKLWKSDCTYLRTRARKTSTYPSWKAEGSRIGEMPWTLKALCVSRAATMEKTTRIIWDGALSIWMRRMTNWSLVDREQMEIGQNRCILTCNESVLFQHITSRSLPTLQRVHQVFCFHRLVETQRKSVLWWKEWRRKWFLAQTGEVTTSLTSYACILFVFESLSWTDLSFRKMVRRHVRGSGEKLAGTGLHTTTVMPSLGHPCPAQQWPESECGGQGEYDMHATGEEGEEEEEELSEPDLDTTYDTAKGGEYDEDNPGEVENGLCSIQVWMLMGDDWRDKVR